MKIGDILQQQFDISLVLLSFFIAMLGSYVALECAVRIRGRDGKPRFGYVASAAVAIGGVAIWSMHFIGMTALNVAVPVGYDGLITLVSLVAAVVVAGIALWFVGRSEFRWSALLIGGTGTGLGVAVMHYLGMAAMRMPARIVWSTPIVLLSIVIAIVASIVALWLCFNLRSRVLRVAAAAVMAVAVCGMHYTGMVAGTFVCTSLSIELLGSVRGHDLPFFVFSIALMILGALTIYMILNYERRVAAVAS